MTKVVNDTDKLTFILTRYGLERIAEALSDEAVEIKLTKIKVGDANYEYYEPTEEQTELRNRIKGGSFYIIGKDLLEDGLTVSLHTVFPEALDNCEIREVGIYETLNGEDRLFAISTQQPLIKPSTDLRHLISVDYYAFLKSENLAEIYDRIVLDPSNQLVTNDDLENLMRTILFTESNLVDQIGSNSRVIGLNRARQLQEKIEESQEKFSYTTIYNNYSTLLDFVKPEDIFGYWVFNYPRRVTAGASIVDIGKKGRNFSTNKPLNSYDRKYEGFMSMLDFGSSDFFYLNQGVSVLTYNPEVFSTFGNVQISNDGIAGNFNTNDFVSTPDLSVKEGEDWELTFQIRTHEITDEDERVMPQTVISSSYDFLKVHITTNRTLEVALGNEELFIGSLSIPVLEFTEYKCKLQYSNNVYSLSLFLNGEWVEQAKLETETQIPDTLGSLRLGSSATDLYFFGTFDLKEVVIKENGEVVLTGGDYIVENDVSFLDATKTEDIPFTLMFAVEPNEETDRTLLARSDYATNSHIFEVNEKAEGSLEVILFSDSKNFMTYSTEERVIPKTKHSLLLSYEPERKELMVFINGRKVPVVRETTGYYSHMNASLTSLFSFVYTPVATGYADSPNDPTKILNTDGSPYQGDLWSVSNSTVFYDGNLTFYTAEKNIETPRLYAWNYNDGLEDHLIYTKVLEIKETTVLYNEDYTIYTGNDFKVVPVGSNFTVQYQGNDAYPEPRKDKTPKTLYAFVYTGSLQTIWANSELTPSILYTSNGDLYMGDEWYVEGDVIFYKDGGAAKYNDKYNLTIPSLPLTSYVIGKQGLPINTINSKVGMVAIIKSKLKEDELRAFALNLEATIGNNPCITTF